MHMHNKNSDIQGRSPYMVKVIFHTKKERIHSQREVQILKRDAIEEENHCLFQ